MPLSDEDTALILERLRAEQTLRKALDADNKSKRKPLWENPLTLLVVGALLSGILVPWFQFTQKTFEWQRQNQLESQQYQLSQMRDCLTQFILLASLSGEGYERARPFLLRPAITSQEARDFELQFVDVQNRRFAQSSKVASLIVSYRQISDVRDAFDEFLRLSSNYFRAIEGQVRARLSADVLTEEISADEILLQINSVTEYIVRTMVDSIRRMEDENVQFYL